MCPASGGAAPERSEGACTAADAGPRVRASSRGASAPLFIVEQSLFRDSSLGRSASTRCWTEPGKVTVGFMRVLEDRCCVLGDLSAACTFFDA